MEKIESQLLDQLDINLNKEERNALLSFLTIYIASAIFLVGIILYIYYTNEIKSLKNSCSMEVYNASMQIKSEILNKYMKNDKFNPSKLENKDIKYGLFNKDKEVIFSYLDKNFEIDFLKSNYSNEIYNYFISSLDEDDLEVKYIVLESCQEYNNIQNLKYIVLAVLFLSAVFIGFIGYLLSIILLKPVKKRVELMDKFIKDSAHELNTPISVLLTSVTMLKNGKNPEKMMRYIISSSKQVSQIYNDIQFAAFNDIEEKSFEEFNLKDLISESIEFFSDISAIKSIKIDSKLDDCYIKMDRTKALRVVNNLLSNAVKYSKQNSLIEVSLNKCLFSVKDFGIGISKEDQKDIFKRYKRGSNFEGGFGIGLDIVKTVCEEYNLNLSLESKKNEETLFSIDFSNISHK